MFTSILVPIDGTAESNVALPLAHTMARETGATISVLRVLPTSDVPGEDREAVAEATQTVHRIAQELAGRGAQVTAVVRTGNVAGEILAQCRAQGADLIVMRTHGRAGLGRAVLGSVTEHVLAASGVPVLLLRPGERQPRQIRTLVVPIDGSPGGAVALGTAVGLPRQRGQR